MASVNVVVDLARFLISEHSDSIERTLPESFSTRTRMAELPYVPAVRSHRAPNYGTDLGLRRSDDPKEFLSACLAHLGLVPTHEEAWNPSQLIEAWNSESMSDDEYIRHLDVIISYAGMWASAYEIAQQTLEGSRKPKSNRLYTYFGSAMSAAGDIRAGAMFESAGKAGDATPAGKAMAQVRLAAWQIKRERDLGAGMATLERLEAQLDLWAADFGISSGDRNALAGVASNLKALAAVRAGEPQTAMTLLENALEMLSTQEVVTVGDDERRRYYAQANVNVIQLLCDAGEFRIARGRALEHVRWTRSNHLESLSEAFSISGYVSYLAGRWGESVKQLEEAEKLIAEEGSPGRLRMARKTHAASLHRLGRLKDAEAIVSAIGQDSLGLTVLGKGDSHR